MMACLGFSFDLGLTGAADQGITLGEYICCIISGTTFVEFYELN